MWTQVADTFASLLRWNKQESMAESAEGAAVQGGNLNPTCLEELLAQPPKKHSKNIPSNFENFRNPREGEKQSDSEPKTSIPEPPSTVPQDWWVPMPTMAENRDIHSNQFSTMRWKTTLSCGKQKEGSMNFPLFCLQVTSTQTTESASLKNWRNNFLLWFHMMTTAQNFGIGWIQKQVMMMWRKFSWSYETSSLASASCSSSEPDASLEPPSPTGAAARRREAKDMLKAIK